MKMIELSWFEKKTENKSTVSFRGEKWRGKKRMGRGGEDNHGTSLSL
jgi:hypothetical protein